ncbi:MAG: hypothetical protein PWQ84_1204 [Thermotogaceae bacterium]|nr:hypothetical protein [Thermotogaceae bacterium]
MKTTLKTILLVVFVAFLFISCTNQPMELKDDLLDVNLNLDTITYKGVDIHKNILLVGYESYQDAMNLARRLNATVRRNIPEINVVSLITEESVDDLLLNFQDKEIKGIRYIEPSVVRTMPEIKLMNDVNLNESRSISDDPLAPYLWGLEKIGAESVWYSGYTGKGVVVAVLDGGSDSSHPDLNGQYVDGYNAVEDTIIPKNTSLPYGSHGTHVSGIIAAKKDNDEGIVGLAYESKLMPIPIFYGPSSSFIGDDLVAAGFVWAVDNGAKILQNSWGGPGYSQTLKDAIDYALKNNVTVVVSTGNTHIDENWGFPNTVPGIIGVGASNVNDQVTDFSSSGDSVSVVAPGERILSTVAVGDTGGLYGGELPYAYYNGTSMASPYVSALAAMLYQKFPDATAYQIRKIIENGAEDNGISIFRGNQPHEPNYGYGRIDAVKTMELDLPEHKADHLLIEVTDSKGNPVPTVFVTLSRTDGPNYYAKTNENGECYFNQIDPDTYDIFIGGPDWLDVNSLIHRLEEEVANTVFPNMVYETTKKLALQIQSAFEAQLTMPSADVDYNAKIVDSLGNEFQKQTVGKDAVVNFTKPNSMEDIHYYLSVESSPAIVTPQATLTEGFETGDFSNQEWAWAIGGDVAPTVTNIEASEGEYSARFGEMTDEQASWMVGFPVVEVGNYWLKFDIKLSTEEGWDFVNVYVNDVKVWAGSGIYDWQTITVPYSGGEENVVFEYVKDAAVSSGEDTAWIDNIKIIPIPDDFEDYIVTGNVIINGNVIPVEQNLYLGNFVDEFELETVPWTLF